jgi:monoamine oxidase
MLTVSHVCSSLKLDAFWGEMAAIELRLVQTVEHPIAMASSRDADVLVLGAGVAGLMAARQLQQARLVVRVVEARNRIGGRIWTHHVADFDAPIELGAEFIHGRPLQILELAKEGKLPVYEADGDFWCAFDNSLSLCDDFEDRLEAVLERMKPGEPDRSFLEFLDGQQFDQATREAVLAYIEGFEAAHPNRISVHALVREHRGSHRVQGDHTLRPTNGYDGLVDMLARDLNPMVELNSPVRTVRWTPGSVQFECDDKLMTANKAVITLPLSLLQNRSVQFDPPIESKTRALSLLTMGSVIRITLRFRERFWENLDIGVPAKSRSLKDLSFLYSDDEVFPTWWTRMPERSPVLVGWSAGPHAETLSFRDDQFVYENATTSLARKLSIDVNELRRLVVSYHFHDWQADPYSEGAYSYALVGGADAFRELGNPIDDTLFFAGEATHAGGHNGTVHGAVATGERAAREVLASLKGASADDPPSAA